jgi:hypothetical protein
MKPKPPTGRHGLEFKSFPFTLKSETDGADGGCELEGIVACYNSIDLVGDMYIPGCFDEFLACFKSEGVIRDEHEVTTGRIADAKSVPAGLWIKGCILPTAAGRDQTILIKGNAVKRLSLGARNFGQWTDDADEVKSAWAATGYQPTEDDLIRIGYGVRLITRAKPYEASTTWLPINTNTRITAVKSDSADALERPTFDHQSDQALAAVEDWTQRAESLAALRQADGRGLSKKSLSRIGQILDRLTKLTALPEVPSEKPAASATDPDSLYGEFLRITTQG